MAKKKTQTASKKDNFVDVSADETHYIVQCEDVRLITSSLKPLIVEESGEQKSHFAFKIRAVVDGQTAYSYLDVLARHYIPEGPEEVEGFELRFVLMGTFCAEGEVSPENLGEFVKMYTLTVLWPYAREYASDQIRRAGGDVMVLPIINPQVVTEHIVENNLVEVEIIQSEEKVQA